MPFLTVSDIIDSDGQHEKVNQRPTVVPRTMQPQGADEKDPSKTLHERMTLDQYYYTTLPDSTYRDYDQVLSRYLAWQESQPLRNREMISGKVGQNGLPIKVFSVDQLWLWIIDEGKSFPWRSMKFLSNCNSYHCHCIHMRFRGFCGYCLRRPCLWRDQRGISTP